MSCMHPVLCIHQEHPIRLALLDTSRLLL
jgi:hypothetical protein